MESSCYRTFARICGALLLASCFTSGSLLGQTSSFGPSSSASTSSSSNAAVEAVRPAPTSFVSAPQEKPQAHRYWDPKNRFLFATAAALSAGDFCITRSNLEAGGRELNPVTRLFGSSSPGLALNFSLETGSVIGASYLLHRTGHHKLERITAIVNIAGSVGAVSYSVTHH